MKRHHLSLWLTVPFILIIAGCGSRAPSPTVVLVTSTASSTPTLPSPTRTVTITPTPSETPDAATPKYQRPTFDYADPTHLQILAQWSTGAVESHYIWPPDGTKLLLVSAQVTRLIDVQTFQQIWEGPGGKEGAFSSDGQWVRIQNGDDSQVYAAENGQPDLSEQPFSAAASEPMIQPVKSFVDGFDPTTARPFTKPFVNWLAIAILEDGSHRELRFFTHEETCPMTVYTNLTPGITGYSISPDNRLILITAQGTGAERNYQAVILGLNSGFETPLPNRIQDPNLSGFHPTRPSLGIPQRLPMLYAPSLGQMAYPSPIDPPDGPQESYRLKPWDAEAGLDMLEPLVEYATANDVFGPAAGRGSLFLAQEALRMATVEYLSRLPQSSDPTHAQWRLAMTNSILSINETDVWITSEIEQALNQQGLAPEPLSLNAALAPFGFTVDASPFPPIKTPNWSETNCDSNSLPPYPLLADNLFGDDRQSQIFIVKTIGTSVGMVVAVHQNADGVYHVVPVAGQWGLYAGMLQEIDVVDVTGDGQQEIRVDYYWHNGSMNGSITSFYQWQGNFPGDGKFVELTGGIEFDTGGHIPELEILGDPGEPKTLVAHKHGILVFNAIQTLKWDGQRFVSSIRIPLSTDPDLAEGQEPYLKAYYYGQAEEIITLIHSLPANQWRTFLLGYVEALRFHPDQAHAALQPLADQAKIDPGNALAKAASAFLENYQKETDLYRACRAAHQVNQEAPCGTDLALQSLLEHLGSQPMSDLPGVLERLGVNLFYQVQQDFNGDGRDDWLLAEEYAYGDNLLPYQESKMWLVISKPVGFDAQPFDHISPSSTFPLVLSSLYLQIGPNEKPEQVFLLKFEANGRAGGRFFRVWQKGEQWVIDHLLEEWNMSEYQIVEGGKALLIFHNTDRFSPPEIARWNPTTGRFEKSDYLEYLLLTEGRVGEALQLIPSLLEYVEQHPGEEGYTLARYGSYLQYLLGLAYELSGDAENAARVYYNLWKSHPVPTYEPYYLGHPDQPYAIMAREKLEKIK